MQVQLHYVGQQGVPKKCRLNRSRSFVVDSPLRSILYSIPKVENTHLNISMASFEGKFFETPCIIHSQANTCAYTYITYTLLQKFVLHDVNNFVKCWTEIWGGIPTLKHQLVPGCAEDEYSFILKGANFGAVSMI